MPYMMPDSVGGDTKESTKFMEKCSLKVKTQKGKDGKEIGEQGAVAICKSSWIKKHTPAKSSIVDESLSMMTPEMDQMMEDMMDDDIQETQWMQVCVTKTMKDSRVDQTTAENMCLDVWNKTNQDRAKAEYIIQNILNRIVGK
jgi:hypothetical protein